MNFIEPALIMPLFVTPGHGIVREIPSIPNHYLRSVDKLGAYARELASCPIRGVMLYGIPDKKSDRPGALASHHGLIQTAVRTVKSEVPNIVVMADLCLCHYLAQGQCGVYRDGVLQHDETLAVVVPLGLSYADAGVDVLVPSGMLEGLLESLHAGLRDMGLGRVKLIPQIPKFDSGFYAPFRDTVGNQAQRSHSKGSYLVDISSPEQALREIARAFAAGANSVMVKPSFYAGDIIAQASKAFGKSVTAFVSSGEYNLVRSGSASGSIQYEDAILEHVRSIGRSGATMIVSYFAHDYFRIPVEKRHPFGLA